MSDMRTLAQRAMTGKTISDAIKKIGDDAKSELLEAMTAVGSERIRVTDADATDFGTVSLTLGRQSARIVDQAAFLAWVVERYPDQLIQTVNPAFAARLLDGAARKGDPVDEHGELVPGVQIVVGDSYLTVRPTTSARAKAAELLDSHLPAIGT